MTGFDSLLTLVVVGITTGSVYAIAAMGLVLTFRTSGVFNFAHGAQAAVGAYLMHSLRSIGMSWPLAAAGAIVVAGILGGFALERLARVLAARPPTARIVATIGLLIGVQGALVASYGTSTIVFDRFLPETTFVVVGVSVRMSQLLVVALAAAAAVGLYLFFRRARIGVAMQAVVDDPALLSLMAINPQAVRRWAWTVGSVFAAVSGILLAHELNLDAAILSLLVVQAFGAAALGAFHSLPGTYLGALTIGIAVALLPDHLGQFSALAGQSTFPFLVLFAVLLLTPRRRLVDRAVTAVTRMREPRPASRRLLYSVGVPGGLLVLAGPLLVGSDIALYSQALAAVVLLASLFLLVRTSGQVSLCHMAFAGIGAVVTARLAVAGAPWMLAVLLGGLAAVPVGAVVAIPAIRLSGIYLAIATFGFGIVIERVVFPLPFLFGGGVSSVPAPRPRLLELPTNTDVGYYYVLVAVAVLAVVVVVSVQRTRLGRLLRGLADSPEALAAHGVDTRATRLYAFVIAAFLAGVGGAIAGGVTGTAGAASFSFAGSLQLLAILWLAGRRLVPSVVIGALLLTVAPSLVDHPTVISLMPVAFGLAAIVAAVSDPDRDVAADVRGHMLRGRWRDRAMAPPRRAVVTEAAR